MIQLFCDFWCRSAIDKDLNFDRDLYPTICIMRINMLQTIGYGINIYMVTFYECVFKNLVKSCIISQDYICNGVWLTEEKDGQEP